MVAYQFKKFISFPHDLEAFSSAGNTASPSSSSNARWMALHIVEYSKENLTTRGAAVRKSTVTLPLPAHFVSETQAGWGTQSLGVKGSAISGLVSGVQDDMAGEKNRGGMSMVDSLRSRIGQGAGIYARSFAEDAAFNFAGEIAPGVTNAVLQGLGVTRNPFNAVLFEGPEFRSFQFQWKLYPKNEAESRDLYEIVKSLKVAMSTRYNDSTNLLFDYPYILNINTSNEDKTFKIAPCAIVGVSSNVHPENQALYRKSDYPVGIDLTISLKELVILTADDVADGFT